MTFTISRQVVLSKAPEGPLAGDIGPFAESLTALGYSSSSVHYQVRIGACFSEWLERRDLSSKGITPKHLKQYLRYRARHCRPHSEDAPALTHLMEFLRREGVIPAEKIAVHEHGSIAHCVTAYEAYLREARGLATPTIIHYAPVVRDFLKDRFGAKPVDLFRLSGKDILGFVQRRAPRVHRKQAKLITTALRSFLNYARYSGQVDADLTVAVPVVPNWSMTTIPRAISPDQVRQLLASIDRGTGMGRRDYAIILLLARLGLRVGEVVSLRLEDIDWKAGELSVVGKTGRRNDLPLTTEVGQAIVAYLKDGRPHSTSRSVFLRSRAPLRGFQGSPGIDSIVRHSLQRCGIDTPTKGAHQFRHGLATEMLRQGASLGEIGDVLGHRHLQTTSIYAKVDVEALRALALPWPRSPR